MLYKELLENLKGCPFRDGENQTFIDQEHAFLTYALAPYHRHHLLVIPKRHVESVKELRQEEWAEIERLQDTALGLLERLGYDSVTMLVREGGGTKTIRHVHFHVVPEVQIGDFDHYGRERQVLTPDEIRQTLDEITEVLSATTPGTQ